jgi:hypothetical protein
MNFAKSGFCKNEGCPSSTELLDYQNGDLHKARAREIGGHLSSCEFCDAEVEFYSNYPQATDDATPEIGEIPAPLYELAEALLRNRERDTSSLNALLKDKKNLVADKV